MTDGDDRARAAAATLGEAARALSEVVVLTEVDAAELLDAADRLDEVRRRLSRRVRGVREVPSVERFEGVVRVFSPLDGPAHPASFPLEWEHLDHGSVRGRARLGARFEGPPGLLHGGLIAALFDQVLGAAVVRAGVHALTASLSVSYLRPVPLDEEVVLTAGLDSSEGRRHRSSGVLTTASDPAAVCARAEALFITPAAGRSAAYFGSLRRSGGGAVDFPMLG